MVIQGILSILVVFWNKKHTLKHNIASHPKRSKAISFRTSASVNTPASYPLAGDTRPISLSVKPHVIKDLCRHKEDTIILAKKPQKAYSPIKIKKKNDNVLHLSHLRQNKILGQPHLVKSKKAFAQVLQ